MPEPLAARTSGRVFSIVQCRRCTWAAEMRGDTSEEVAAFLRELAERHTRSQHPGLPLQATCYEERL